MNAVTNDDDKLNVLFVCTGNSARSIMAEAILNRIGEGRFRAYSAGIHPRAAVDTQVLSLLTVLKYPTGDLRPKDWREFTGPAAPRLDIVITVCDKAANEECPPWEGGPVTATWSLPDPMAFDGLPVERQALIADIFRMLERRIGIVTNLPKWNINRRAIEHAPDSLASPANDRDADHRPGLDRDC